MENLQTMEVSVLSKFDITKQELESFLSDYKNLVITDENMKEAVKARAAIREKRYAIQAQQKSNDDKRIAWNKKAMADNKAAAEELLSLISPVENPIDEKIKEFEERKEAERQAKLKEEQDRINARIKAIEHTGAEKNELGYNLGSAFIGHDEFKSLSESIFDRILLTFETEAKIIADKKAEEEAILKAEEDEKERIKKLHEERLESLMPVWNFVSAENRTLNFGLLSEVEFQLIKDDALKALNDYELEKERIKAYQEDLDRKKKEQEDAEQKFAEEKAQIEADLKAFREEMIKSRKTALFALGMSETADAFVFGAYRVFIKEIEETTAWDNLYTKASGIVSDIKAAIENEMKIMSEQKQKDEDERIAKEAARLEALRPDEEKLKDFVRSLGNITGPELSTEEGRGILEHAISQIRDTQAFIRESLNALRNE